MGKVVFGASPKEHINCYKVSKPDTGSTAARRLTDPIGGFERYRDVTPTSGSHDSSQHRFRVAQRR